eukprot:3668065-Prymnesium_polylepis.1
MRPYHVGSGVVRPTKSAPGGMAATRRPPGPGQLPSGFFAVAPFNSVTASVQFSDITNYVPVATGP